MNDLVKTNEAGRDVTTSLKIAEVFGKRHDHVLRDIEKLECSDEFRFPNFGEASYLNPNNNQTFKMYEITKDGFSFLVMGYTGKKAAEFKESFINEFNKRESMLKNDDYILLRSQEILTVRAKLLKDQLDNANHRLQLQESTIKEQAPKVEYYETVLMPDDCIPINIIAKELGMTAIILNKILNDRGIQYKQSGTWVLYRKYQDLDFTKTKTHTYQDGHGNTRTDIHTYWTQKGREFIHSLMKRQAAPLRELSIT